MAYINPDIFEIDWDNLTDWTDGDTNGAVSEIDPAGQLHLDLISATDDAVAAQFKDLGTIGTGNYYVEVRFIGDTWDNQTGDANDGGIEMAVEAGTNRVNIWFGNNFTAGDGILVHDGTSKNRVDTTTWDNNWHTVVFYVHNSQTDMDIWIDKDPATEAADVTDADCSLSGGTDGTIYIIGSGSAAGNGEYHLDLTYVGSELLSTSSSFSSSSSSSFSSSSSSSFSSSSSSSSLSSSNSSSSFSSSSFSSSSSSCSSSFSSSSSSSSSSSCSSSFSSSSCSSSFSSSSSSSFSSSSSSISSISNSSSSSSSSAYPISWGIAWGEQNPDGDESAESWATWSDGVGGSPTIIGDADWGKLQLVKDAIAHSPVHHFGNLDTNTWITENKYGSGFGSFKVYYRESDTPFIQDAGAPAWTEYTIGPVHLTLDYRQIKLLGE